MAAIVRLRALVLAIVVLGIGAGVALWIAGGSEPSQQVVAEPTPMPTAPATPALPPNILGGRVGLHAIPVPGPRAEDLIILETIASSGGTQGQLIIWRTDGELKTQLFPAVSMQGPTNERFSEVNSAIISGLQQTLDGKRELGIVYDASAYGSGSPSSSFVLFRLEGDRWRMVWNPGPGWRSAHGRVEFPQGDLSQLMVRSDSAFGHDPLSGVLFEANAGPHRQFVDTWVREGDGYVRQSAETVPSAYATLVEFLYALGTGDDSGARALVTDASLLDRARSLGLDAAMGKNWNIHCDDWAHCLEEGPIGFDPQAGRGEPNALTSFVERNGRWLISDIREQPSP